ALAAHERSIRSLVRLTAPGDGVAFSPNASVQAEGIMVEMDTSAGIDVAAERRRLEKDRAAAVADAPATGRKRANSPVRAQAAGGEGGKGRGPAGRGAGGERPAG